MSWVKATRLGMLHHFSECLTEFLGCSQTNGNKNGNNDGMDKKKGFKLLA